MAHPSRQAARGSSRFPPRPVALGQRGLPPVFFGRWEVGAGVIPGTGDRQLVGGARAGWLAAC